MSTIQKIFLLMFLLIISSCQSTTSPYENNENAIAYRDGIKECDIITANSGITKSNAVKYYSCIVSVKEKYDISYKGSSFQKNLDEKKLSLSKSYSENKITYNEFIAGIAANSYSFYEGKKYCEMILKDGVMTKNDAYPYQKCIVSVKENRGMYANDLDKALDLKQVELAEKFSSGQITASEYNSRVAEYNIQINSVRQSRDNAAQTLQNQQQIINNMNRPVITNCNKFGTSTNCTTY